MLKVLFAIFLCSGYLSLFAQTSTLKLIVTNLENNEGTVNVPLYNETNKVFFPKHPDSAFVNKTISIINCKAVVIFSNVPFGAFTVSVFHDENSNGKIDRTFIGFPSESYGISGNKFVFGPPDFEDGKFVLNSSEKKILIKLKHML